MNARKKKPPKPVLPSKSGSLIDITLRKFFNFLGYAGAISVIYGTFCEIADSPWPPLDEWMVFFSSLLTLAGTILTASTVYFWRRQPFPPEKFSLYVSCPLVLVSATTAAIVMMVRGELSPAIINGFALLAIAGALFRIQPHTTE